MTLKYNNNARTTLSAGINSSVTSITVVDGSVFPTLTGIEYFYMTLEDVSLNREVVKVTARTGNTLTVVRGQDGSTARAFSIGDKAEGRLVAAMLTDLSAPSYILSALLTVDGVGSGLDADLFDGLSSAAYAQLAVANVFIATQTINNNSSAAPSPGTTGVALHLSGADGVSTRLWLDAFGTGTNYTARRANGTNAAKTTLIGGDVIMNNTAFGYDGTAYSTGAQAAFQIAASQTWAVGAHGTRMIFQVVPDNSTTLTPRWVMEQDGSLMYSGATATGASTVNALNYFVAGTNISSIYQTIAGYTAADVLAKLLTVDGAGSGLDADLLDGNNIGTSGTAVPLLSATNTWAGNQTFQNATSVYTKVESTATSSQTGLQIITRDSGGVAQNSYIYVAAAADPAIQAASGSFGKIWFAANDGAGSGLDADLLDGLNSSAFGQLSAANVWTGASATFNYGATGDSQIAIGGSNANDAYFYLRGNAGQTRSVVYQTGSSTRWQLYADTVAESGSNAGSNFHLRAYSDASASLGDVFTAGRNTLVATFTNTPTVAGSAIWHAGNDGAGSGLDADLWDGNNFATYIDQTLTTASTPRFAWIHIGTDTDLRIYESSTNVMTLRAGGVGTETYLTIGASNTLQVGGYNIYHTANDGAGSGLDADLWDGNNFATYLNQAVLTSSAPSFAGATFTAGVAITSTAPSLVLLENDQGTDLKRWDFIATAGTLLIRMVNDANSLATNLVTITRTSTYTAATWNYAATTTLQYNSNTIWHAGNDGAGSGLDADLWDGNNFATYLNQAVLTTSTPTFGGLTLTSATGFLPQINITNTSDDANAGYVVLRKSPADTLVTAADYIGTVLWYGRGSATADGTAATVYARAEGTRGTNWVAADLVLGSMSTAGAYRYLMLNAVGTITWNGSTVWTAANDGAGSGLDADTLDSYNVGTSGSTIPLLNANNTYSGISAFTGQVTMSRGAVPLQITTTVDNGNVQGLIIEGDRATPTNNDIVYMDWRLSNSAGTQTEFGRQSIVASTVTAASEVSYWSWFVRAAGVLTETMRLSSSSLQPAVSGAMGLGNASLMWNSLFLSSGSVINFNNGDVTVTHSANTLAFAGASTGYTFDAPLTISSTAANNPLVITSTEAGAVAFTVDLFRDSASPAASDALAALRFRGRNSTPATVTYSAVQSTIVDPTAASEDANLYLQTMMAGTLTNGLTVGFNGTQHRFAGPTDIIVSSVGSNGYGAFYAIGSGTNAAYLFMGNGTNGERSRITAVDSRSMLFSNDGGVTQHFGISVAGVLTATGNTVWHAGNDGAGSTLDADLLDGIDSTRVVYGINGSGSTGANATQTLTELAQYKSGFWDVTGAAWTPTTGYWWGITMAHISNGPAYNFGGQIIIQNSAGTPAAYLRSISGGATPAATAWQQIWTSAVDGSGSGLDADLLDGLNSAQFVRADVATIMTSGVLLTSQLNSNTTLSGQSGALAGGFEARGNGTGPALISFHRPSAYAAHIGIDTDNIWKVGGWSMGANAYAIWHSGVDGSGSGLDADMVDGYHMNQNVLTSSSPSFVDVTITSDERLKSDIIPIAGALEKVRKLRGAEYTRRATGKREIGVIAQDLEAAGLELLVDRTESNLRTVKYMRLSAVLIEAVKELADRVEQLERAA